MKHLSCGSPHRGASLLVAALAACIVLAAPRLEGQDLFMPGGDLVTARTALSLSVFHPGSTGYLAVSADVAAGWHINSNKPLDKFLIPTVLEITAPDGIEIAKILYPEPTMKKLQVSEGKMSLYDGHAVFGVLIRIGRDVKPGEYSIAAVLTYQGCNNLTCIEPGETRVEATLKVGTPEETVEALSPEIFSKPPFVDASGKSAAAEGKTGEVDIGDMVRERGLFIALLAIFVAGLGLSLTPCLYPLIPITVSYFGGQAQGKTSRRLLLALLYVLGMSITYSALGTVAALTGSLFGAALQNPWVIAVIIAVLLALAASMFGIWEMHMPVFLTRRTGSAKRGYAGAVLMGLTMGIIAAPCIGPFVLALLTYVGEIGKPLLGFLMFFTLSWGMGAPFVVLGVLSGSISHLPRSGDWMVWVRKIFGFILIAMAFYFARSIIGPRYAAIGYALTCLAAGLYLGWLDRSEKGGAGFRALRRAVGVAGIALACLFVFIAARTGEPGASKPGIPWTPYAEDLLGRAAGEGKPVIIDFTADWCVLCHELESTTFSDAKVIGLAKRAVALRVDLTTQNEFTKGIKDRFTIRGLPVIIFIDRAGAGREDLRVTGFVDAAEFAKRLEQIVGPGDSGGVGSSGGPGDSGGSGGAR